jgi:hypothetical protein
MYIRKKFLSVVFWVIFCSKFRDKNMPPYHSAKFEIHIINLESILWNIISVVFWQNFTLEFQIFIQKQQQMCKWCFLDYILRFYGTKRPRKPSKFLFVNFGRNCFIKSTPEDDFRLAGVVVAPGIVRVVGDEVGVERVQESEGTVVDRNGSWKGRSQGVRLALL